MRGTLCSVAFILLTSCGTTDLEGFIDSDISSDVSVEPVPTDTITETGCSTDEECDDGDDCTEDTASS
jgi:hypothetical protein